MTNEDLEMCLRPLTMLNEAGDETEQRAESRAAPGSHHQLHFVNSSDNSCENVKGHCRPKLKRELCDFVKWLWAA